MNAEVDTVMRLAKNTGAVIVESTLATFSGGYAGYIQDSSHRLWVLSFAMGKECMDTPAVVVSVSINRSSRQLTDLIENVGSRRLYCVL